jgi:hypothetical protein
VKNNSRLLFASSCSRNELSNSKGVIIFEVIFPLRIRTAVQFVSFAVITNLIKINAILLCSADEAGAVPIRYPSVCIKYSRIIN